VPHAGHVPPGRTAARLRPGRGITRQLLPKGGALQGTEGHELEREARATFDGRCRMISSLEPRPDILTLRPWQLAQRRLRTHDVSNTQRRDQPHRQEALRQEGYRPSGPVTAQRRSTCSVRVRAFEADFAQQLHRFWPQEGARAGLKHALSSAKAKYGALSARQGCGMEGCKPQGPAIAPRQSRLKTRASSTALWMQLQPGARRNIRDIDVLPSRASNVDYILRSSIRWVADQGRSGSAGRHGSNEHLVSAPLRLESSLRSIPRRRRSLRFAARLCSRSPACHQAESRRAVEKLSTKVRASTRSCEGKVKAFQWFPSGPPSPTIARNRGRWSRPIPSRDHGPT